MGTTDIAATEVLAEPRRRGRPRQNSRADEVLACASAMFGTRGYVDTSLEDIATQLGMTRAGLYYYAESKEDLLEKCYEWTHARYTVRLNAELGEGTGREMLERFFLVYGEAVCDDASRCFLSSEDHYLSPERQQQSAKRIADVNDKVAELLHRGINDGSLVAQETRYAMAALLGAFNSLHRLQRPGGPSPREMGKKVLKVLMEGLQAG